MNACLLTFESPQMGFVFSLYEGELLSWWAPEQKKVHTTPILLLYIFALKHT